MAISVTLPGWPRLLTRISLRRAWQPLTPPRLLQEILQLTLLLFNGTFHLVLLTLGLLGLVAGYGASSLFGPALDLIHRPFALVLAAALPAHLLLPSSIFLPGHAIALCLH